MYRSDKKILRCTLYIAVGNTLYVLALTTILNLLAWVYTQGYLTM